MVAELTALLPTIPPIPPTINKTISLSILVYAWSIGAIDLIGCVTKVTEYRSANTIPKRITVIATTTKPQIRTSISSGFSFCAGVLFRLINLFLQYRGYEVFRTGLSELTSRLLTLLSMKVIRVLTVITISIFTAS